MSFLLGRFLRLKSLLLDPSGRQKDLFQVHHQKNQNNFHLARLLETTSEPLKSVTSLALAEFSLNCIPFP